MKSWRVLGLVWAVLSLGSLGACGDDGGGGKSDGGSDSGYDDRESGIEPEDDGGDVVVPEDDGGDVDAGDDGGDIDATVEAGGEVDACEAKSCSQQGFNCGVAKDGCGGDLNCGPEKCSGN